jgi:hypothetical protein
MVVFLVVLFLIAVGLIVAYYMGYLDKYITPEAPPPPPLVPAPPEILPSPSLTTPDTPAPDESPSTGGTFPEDIQGLSGRYTIDGFNDETDSWTDFSSMKNHILDVKGDLKSEKGYVFGTRTVGFKIPIGIFGPDKAYTMFYVARYNGPLNKRIFDGTDNNWLSGFHNTRTGVAHHNAWLTQNSTAVHGPHEWVIGTDAPNRYRSGGEDRVINKSVYNSTSQITVNMGQYAANESSDWAIKEMIFYNRLLNNAEIGRVEAYLLKRYKSELPSDIYAAKGFEAGKLVNDPRPVPYGYGTPEFCRQEAISLGYPVWGHRGEKHANENLRNKCFYYTEGAFDDFDENESDEVHQIGCTDPKKDIFTGCPE